MRAGSTPVYAAVIEGRVEMIVYRSEAVLGEDAGGNPLIGEPGWFWFAADHTSEHIEIELGELPDQSETTLDPEHDAALEAAAKIIEARFGLEPTPRHGERSRGLKDGFGQDPGDENDEEITDEQIEAAFPVVALSALEEVGGAATLPELLPQLAGFSALEIISMLEALEAKGEIGSSGDPKAALEGGLRFYVRGGDVEAEFLAVKEQERAAQALSPEVRLVAESLRTALLNLGLLEAVMQNLADGEEPEETRAARAVIARCASALAQQRGLPPDYEGPG